METFGRKPTIKDPAEVTGIWDRGESEKKFTLISDEKIKQAWNGAVDPPVAFDLKLTLDERYAMRNKAVAQAQIDADTLKAKEIEKASYEAGYGDAENKALISANKLINQVAKREFDNGKAEGIKTVVDAALQAIIDEPELPGEMPDEMWNELNGDRESTTTSMQYVVRRTKSAITERFESFLQEHGLGG